MSVVDSVAGVTKFVTALTVGWFFFLGVVGAVLMGGTAYAIVTGSLLLGFFCGLTLFAPLILTLVGALAIYCLPSSRRHLGVAPPEAARKLPALAGDL